MTSKTFPAISFTDVNRLVPENDTAKCNNNVLLPFPYYEDEDSATQAAVKCNNNYYNN